jgi:hypothetical protein
LFFFLYLLTAVFLKNVIATAFWLPHLARNKDAWDGDDEAVEWDTDVRGVSRLTENAVASNSIPRELACPS